MTRGQIVELYGTNVYQIRLQIAIAFYVHSDPPWEGNPDVVFECADHFIKHMESDEHKELA